MEQFVSAYKNLAKKFLLGQPVLTVITVVYNGEKTLEETVRSVTGQTYRNIEYVIIDGASRDGTLEIIRKYQDKIDVWISEPDRGIYDAMNKGIDLAHGEWINFMNAGDYFYSSETISEFIGMNPDGNYHYYGDNIYFTQNISWVFLASLHHKTDFLKHNTFSHQAVFYSLNCLKEAGKYNTVLKISADFDITLRCFKKTRFIKLNGIIARCDATPFGTNSGQDNAYKSYSDRIQSFKNNKELLFMVLIILYFPVFCIKHILSENLKNTFLYNIFRKIKYKCIE
ncbi:MAG: glycosyltransferase [Bacteroidales bacterium]|jgi:glycosyltransferase involved in cell wall biosynthesis|nr:glycosyltransferase [Bacteroidales bacterium]